MADSYIIELRNSSDDLVAILHQAHNINYTQLINSPHMLTFTLPADDAKIASLIKANEIWIRNYTTGTLVKRFLLNKTRDIRV